MFQNVLLTPFSAFHYFINYHTFIAQTFFQTEEIFYIIYTPVFFTLVKLYTWLAISIFQNRALSPNRCHYQSKYKLLHFLITTIFLHQKALNINWARCCHLVLCLQLIFPHLKNMFQSFLSTSIESHRISTLIKKPLFLNCDF